jgi:hypothetical protein
MSDVAQGPGWWLASDQKWYPPEAQQIAAYSPPTSAPVAPPAPRLNGKKSKKAKVVGSPRHPGVWDDRGTGHGLSGIAGAPIGPPEMDKKRYALSRPLTFVVAIILIGAATFGVVKLGTYLKNGGDPPAHESPSAVATSFTEAFLQTNASTANADLPPGEAQTFVNNEETNFSNASFEVSSVTMTSPTTAVVTITACPEMGTPCSSQLKGELTGQLPVTQIKGMWYVDLKYIYGCGTGPFQQQFDCL